MGFRSRKSLKLSYSSEVRIISARLTQVLFTLGSVGLFDGGQIHLFDS